MADTIVENCTCTYQTYKAQNKEYLRRSFTVSCPTHDKSLQGYD